MTAPTAADPLAIQPRALYGGAMQINVPASFLDVSVVRQVPSHQEVFVDQLTDQSIMIELLDLVEEAHGDEVGRYHFAQLASDNDAAESEIITQEGIDVATVLPSLPPTTKATIVTGRQSIAKFNEQSADAHNVVLICLAVVRLPDVATDLLLSLNCPTVLAPLSSSAAAVPRPAAGDELEAKEIFARMLHSLRILDWSLFGAS
ncbi:hypothetical protein BDZ88DRAFT_412998 [Geranomyces variabilis]|nr:hypothetical protein BDZ88DRAFT_412998 [Geranomyces variabilis]KAJ3136855.1 hypothetical protein HDU90_002421 [Geranomyces variabilis]